VFIVFNFCSGKNGYMSIIV